MALGLYITQRCNLDCRYCFNWDAGEKRGSTDLSYSDVCEVLSAGREKGHQYLTITGGEPLLHRDIFGIIDYAYDLGYMSSILTNGLLVNQDVAARLQGNSRLRIRISLEAADEKVHEYLRGAGTFGRTLAAIETLVGHNVSVGLGLTVCKENVEEIEQVIQLGLRLGCQFVRISPVVRIRKGKRARLSPDFHGSILTKLVEIQIANREHIEFPGQDLRFSVPIEAIVIKRCQAGSGFFGINPEKTILPCPLIRGEAKVFRKPFTGIEDFDTLSHHMEGLFGDLERNLKGSCASCEFGNVCCGGCLAEKLSFDLTLYEEQPVCYKKILERIERQYGGEAFDVLKRSWFYRINSSQERGERGFCYRHAPFWTVLFKRAARRR